jgi:glycosyltransferase involved in cell wall biosynthesis
VTGNLGLAHEVETIRGVMLRLRDDDRFRFVFAGGGPSRKDLEEFCREKGLSMVAEGADGGTEVPRGLKPAPQTVEFRPYCSLEELGRSLSEGHVGLVTQKPETLGCVVPSKTYGIMAAGRPVLFIGPKDATPARIVERFRCGWHVEPGDMDGLVALLDRLARYPEDLRAAGARAREAFEEHYDLPIGVARITSILGLPVEANVLARVASR